MPLKERALSFVGLICVALGFVGIFLPLLPTTPFLLLAAYLFARSNKRLHRWLLGHPQLGPYIHAFRNKTGLTRSQKARLAISFTLLFGISIWLVPSQFVKIGLGAVWAFWMVWLYRLKAADQPMLSTL